MAKLLDIEKPITLVILLLIFSPWKSFSQGKQVAYIPNAYEWAKEFSQSSIDNGDLQTGHMILIEGYTILDDDELKGGLSDMSMSDIALFNLISPEKAKMQFDGEIARRGILIIELNDNSKKKFSKNMKRYNKYKERVKKKSTIK